MTINYDKTVFMRITHKKTPLLFHYGANGIGLSEVAEYKYLGLWFTNNLQWSKHIDVITNKALRKLFFLRRSLKLATPSVRFLAYQSIICPMLEYAMPIWDPYTKTNISKLERIQKKVVRYIYNSYGRSSVTEVIKRSGLPTVTKRNKICRLKLLYQIVKGHYNIDTSHIITFSEGYATRQRHSLMIAPLFPRNNCFKYSFFCRTIADWNNLTNNIVTQESLSLFEKCLE